VTTAAQEKALVRFVSKLPEPKHTTAIQLAPALERLCDALTAELIYAFLIWQAGANHASSAAKRITDAVVDLNELRICLPDELAEFLGARTPNREERAARLRLTLNDLYAKRHATSLAGVEAMTKRESRAFLESLEAIPPFVAARVFLIGLGGHAFPVDQRLAEALADAGAIPDDLDADAAASWLERQFRAGDAAEAYLRVEDWAASRRKKRSTATKPRATTKTKRSARKSSKRKSQPKST